MTTIIKCKDCNNDFEKTSENFYSSKGVLQTTRCKKCKAKQIYQINKRKGNDYSKYRDYYQTYMREYNKKMISCECGSNITRGRMPQHIKTKIHARRLMVKEEELRKVSLSSLPSS